MATSAVLINGAGGILASFKADASVAGEGNLCAFPYFRYSELMSTTSITPRGQVTLPAGIRKALGLKGGDSLEVTIENGRIVLQPVMTLPIRHYSDDDVAMFTEAADLSDSEFAAAVQHWQT